jgi:hypothetical protein
MTTDATQSSYGGRRNVVQMHPDNINEFDMPKIVTHPHGSLAMG